MKTKRTPFSDNHSNAQRGFAVVLLMIFTFTLLALTAVAVDIGKARAERHKMQIAVDAGSLAAARMLKEAVIVPTVVKQEARDLAAANGVSNYELATAGDVVLGNWGYHGYDYNFAANIQPFNAVQVRAQRNVTVHFARAFNTNFVSPRVESIAYMSNCDKSDCVIPYGVEQAAFETANYGDIVTVDMASPGNWGKLDIGGNMSSRPQFIDAMINGACADTVQIGDQISPGTGYGGVHEGFEGRVGVSPLVIVPVVDSFTNGNAMVTVVGFALAELIIDSGHSGNSGNSDNNGVGNGANWTGEIRYLAEIAGSGGDGPSTGPYCLAPSLVK